MYHTVKTHDYFKSCRHYWHSWNQLFYSNDVQVNTNKTAILWNPRQVVRGRMWKREMLVLLI